MPRDGSGNYSRAVAAYTTGSVIAAAAHNSEHDDFASALTASVAKDGQTAMTASLPMGTNKIVNMGSGTARTDAAAVGQIQDAAVIWGGTAGGTADALTLTLTPAITAYVAGMTIRFIAGSTNTTAATLAVNGLAAKDIEDVAGDALAAGAIAADALCEVIYDGTAFRLRAGRAALYPGNVPIVLADATALSGSATQITGIPATATMVDIMLDNIASDGSVAPMIQIGPSGGVVTTGYLGAITALTNGSSVATSAYSTGFVLAPWSNAVDASGHVRLRRASLASNIWTEDHSIGRHDGGVLTYSAGAGRIALSGALERLRIATSDTFTAGTITVFYL